MSRRGAEIPGYVGDDIREIRALTGVDGVDTRDPRSRAVFLTNRHRLPGTAEMTLEDLFPGAEASDDLIGRDEG